LVGKTHTPNEIVTRKATLNVGRYDEGMAKKNRELEELKHEICALAVFGALKGLQDHGILKGGHKIPKRIADFNKWLEDHGFVLSEQELAPYLAAILDDANKKPRKSTSPPPQPRS
jgi:hypothetical protein